MPRLIYSVGGAEQSVEVGDSASIGRIPGNTVVLPDEAGASRRHAQILKVATGYELNDLGSTNGTKVNGRPVKRHKLKSGDRIEIGATALTWDDPADAAAEEEEVSLEEPAGRPVAAAAGASGAGTSGAGTSDQCYLVYAGGERDGQKILLDKPRVTFGRNPKSTVQIMDAMVSGHHAEIAREGGAYVLRDLGSTNGTLCDGEPVSEVALQHGNRIRLGNVRLVFVDPAVSDFEKAMAAVDDLGSEWGLLRAEMDLSRVQRARRSQAIAIVAVLLIVGGAGWLVVANPDLISPRKPEIVVAEGNVVPDPSFEDQLGGNWAALPESPARARINDPKEGAAKQGTAFFAVSRDGPLGRPSVARLTAKAFTVSPGRSYEFGASVRTTGGGRGGVRLAWVGDDGALIAHNSTRLGGASAWEDVRGRAVPPEGASRAWIELANVADGTAYFDDVVFRPSGESAAPVTAAAGPVRVQATPDGLVTMQRGEAKLLVRANVVGGSFGPDALDATRRGDRAGSASVTSVTAADGGVRVQGQAMGAKGAWSDFTVTWKPAEDRYVDVTAELPADAGIVAILPVEFVNEGMGVHIGTAFTRLSEPRVVDKVQHVTMGGRNRFRVSAAEGSDGFRLALYQAGAGWEVGFGSSSGALSLRIDTDAKALGAVVQSLRTELQDSVAMRRFGRAVRLARELSGNFPAGSAEALAAEQQAQKHEESGQKALRALADRASGAAAFQDTAAIQQLRPEAETLAKEYDEHAVGAEAKAILEQADQAVAARRKAENERDAQPILRRADDYLAREMKILAAALYREVADRFPGTEAAEKALEQLVKLGIAEGR